MDFILLAGLIASWLLILAGAVLLYQVIRQNGRVLLRLEAAERWLLRFGPDPYDIDDYLGTLPIGVSAPAFELPDLNGVPRPLSEWRGRRVLLVFFDPACVFSRELLPYLAALQDDTVPGRPAPVIVATGGLAANRALFSEGGFTGPVLLQDGTEVAEAYKVDGTPMSYLIEADGSVASEVAAGVQATLVLAGEPAADSGSAAAPAGGATALTPRRVSRLGLMAGTEAPPFRLPRLDGGEMSLLEFRGREVIVVFLEPGCEPCLELAPRLERAYRESPAPAMVVVSRGGVEENRAMSEAAGLSMPVLLQREWEVSREYDNLAAPAAFLVDEWGVIAGNVAMGSEAVLALIAWARASRQDGAPANG